MSDLLGVVLMEISILERVWRVGVESEMIVVGCREVSGSSGSTDCANGS